MIKIQDVPLANTAQGWLRRYQSEINGIGDYAERVAVAKSRFKARNSTDNATFRAVRETLAAMCSGARRCMYCEDSCGDEVEHIKPKDLYPEFVFAWNNYLYSCGPCNGRKNNRYAVISRQTQQLVNVTRQRGAPVERPTDGDPALIDPRFEDPLDFLELDLMGTFVFLPSVTADAESTLRAEYTIDSLDLNRDVLLEAREEACGSYRARLTEYILLRDSGVPDSELQTHISALMNMGHPTVWREMRRQRDLIAALSDLFSNAPEALHW
jgi:uncharacterized protein (TIGR02646 family)